ncbi:MAG: AraC family transcriptional regulator [Fibrobacterota bacterium]
MHAATRDKSPNYSKSDAGDPRRLNIVLMVMSGKTVFRLGQERVEAGKGDVICFDTGMLSEKFPGRSKFLSYLLVTFEMIAQDRRLLTFSELGVPARIQPNRPYRIRSLLQSIIATFRSGEPLRLLVCAGLCLELLKALNAEKAVDNRCLEKRPIHYRVREALEYINLNYKKRIDVPFLAKQACMHPAYFSHLFRKEIGMAPHRYVIEVKIAKAKDLLVNHGLPIALLGEELGFHDHSHFHRTFRRLTGVSPGEYAKKNMTLYDPRLPQ